MAYTVNKSDSSSSPNQYTVQDSSVNSQTDLSLVGKGYAGYGELIAENFLHLLENFSSSTAPAKPILGQLYYDSANNRLKVYNGSAFVPAGGNLPYQSTAPSTLVRGDLWIDSDTGQLYFYNGTSSILVGPPSSTGTTNGFVYDSILDSTDTTQNITKWYNNGDLIATISGTSFTPKSALSGFATISKGITLGTNITDNKLNGTATDADKLGGVAATSYLRSDANDTTTGTLGIVTDSGMTIGNDSDLNIGVDGTGAVFTNTIQNTDISFKVNPGGVATTMMTIDGSNSRVGIATASPTATLDVNGAIKGTAFTGNVTGDVTGNVTGNLSSTGANTVGTLVMGNTLTTKNIRPDANTSYDIGTNLLQYNTVYAKATSAQYADLAEVYESDSEYEVGTVVIFGGDKEVTQSTISNDTRVAGVISENPAYLMNNKSEGQAVALVGKVKCRVCGVIAKGDLLTTCGTRPGCAQKAISPVLGSIVGKAMESKDDAGESVILISVGRL